MAIQNRNVNKRRFKPKVHPRRGGSARGGVIAYDPTDPLHEPIANSSSHATPKRRLHIVESSTKHKERVTNLAMYHDRKPIFLASVAVVVYLLLGGIYYMASVEWSFLDSLYFTVTTLTTVGYGDIKPETDAQKIVTCVFMFSGVGIIGAALGVVANIIIDKQRELEAAADQFLEGITQKKHSDGAEDCMTRTKWSLLFSGAAIVLMLSIGTTVMVFAEDYSFVDALYFSCVTVTTVGYGDLAPVKPGTKAFCIVYMLVGTVVIAKALGDLAAIPVEQHQAELEEMVLQQYGTELSMSEFKELAAGGENPEFCTKAEFVLGMLYKLGRVDEHDLDACCVQFEALDRDNSGHLSVADVMQRHHELVESKAALHLDVDTSFDDLVDNDDAEAGAAKRDAKAAGPPPMKAARAKVSTPSPGHVPAQLWRNTGNGGATPLAGTALPSQSQRFPSGGTALGRGGGGATSEEAMVLEEAESERTIGYAEPRASNASASASVPGVVKQS